MKYLCLAYYDEAKFEALSGEERAGIERDAMRQDEELTGSGHLVLHASLQSSRNSTCLRPRKGKPTITDGPYAETKEQVGGFFIIEAKDLNEAIRVASKHPAAVMGENVDWGVEIRPIDFFESFQA